MISPFHLDKRFCGQRLRGRDGAGTDREQRRPRRESFLSQILLRSAPTGVVLAWELPDGRRGATRNVKDASPSVRVTGAPAELALWSFGRVSAAHVTLDGPDEAVTRLAAWRQ